MYVFVINSQKILNKPHFDFRGNYEKYLPGVPQFLILTKVLHTAVLGSLMGT